MNIEDLKKDQWLYLPVSPYLNCYSRPCIKDSIPSVYNDKTLYMGHARYIWTQIVYVNRHFAILLLPRGWGYPDGDMGYISNLKSMQHSLCSISSSELEKISSCFHLPVETETIMWG